ncbi:SRPBCC family protein [Streptomyces scabiei]|uniref:SRPBCC family protein n=1 Tax=Streptomyces scabiei TaxID=1930 RepID=UPI0004E64899|nr:ATPase [Streptomyces scabiei]KFG05016.1 ATPase [Streptomyces scabiei]MDX2533965.1 SRPBCC domain-containing protein [Streptomyces scabiei]MDX2795587.1 SRPBCC domain-containing protein [Streptomyces scabiei]MDX2829076.1 SRPBCC domain-containing protein [Streptomyces scabiei]MDX2859966.1 SRPBCC domain-containing protein [Streptomyces scabiei]
MPKEFEIAREFEVDATPAEVWEAVTAGTGRWLWPMEAPEPRVGGKGPFGSDVIAWDPPHRYTNRVEDVEGISEQTLNQLDYTIEPRDEGKRAWVRYVHSGVFVDDWDNQYDGAAKHTGFYLHTLRQYLTHFGGRKVTAFITFDGPEASGGTDALAVVERALGLADDTEEGARVQVEGPGGRLVDVVVDYRDPYFIGLRTDDALIRIFGRNHWGHRVGMSVHGFAPGADAEVGEAAWKGWLNGVFSQP